MVRQGASVRDARTMSEAEQIAFIRQHLAATYGVRVAAVRVLDRAVFDAALDDGRRWVVRVFPRTRPMAQVEGDAAILRYLERQGFPAERCADVRQPVSALYGRGVLVTEFLAGHSARRDVDTCVDAGDMLARLHLLPTDEAAQRPGGALHHYVPTGGSVAVELAAAASWLEGCADAVSSRHRAHRAPFDALRARVVAADRGKGLPLALIHPDPVLKNILVSKAHGPVFVDWSGVGCGPRLFSLALLLWSSALVPGGWSPEGIDAVAAGYRACLQLEDEELERLSAMLRIRPLAFACWRYRRSIKANRIPTGSESWWPDDALADAIAERARAALT